MVTGNSFQQKKSLNSAEAKPRDSKQIEKVY